MSWCNLANFLTILRIILIPFITLTFYIDNNVTRFISTCLFVFACLTDYLDGFVARKLDQTSRLGQMLDPIADKLLIASVMLLLVGFGRVSKVGMIAALIILCREFLVSGLREYLAKVQVLMPVNIITKSKTAVQMIALVLLLYANNETWGLVISVFGEILLWVAAGVTLYSGWQYLKTGLLYVQADGEK